MSAVDYLSIFEEIIRLLPGVLTLSSCHFSDTTCSFSPYILPVYLHFPRTVFSAHTYVSAVRTASTLLSVLVISIMNFGPSCPSTLRSAGAS